MGSHVLVLNTGSSSIKYSLFDMDAAKVVLSGLVEGIGEANGAIKHVSGGTTNRQELMVADHRAGLRAMLEAIASSGVDLDSVGVVAVGHRVVHGGAVFSAPTIIDDRVLDTVRELVPLAPLHNPANIIGIEVARELFPSIPHVAVFDTAFHQTMPPRAYTYAIDAKVASEFGIRRYGFHGTSHAYVSRAAAALIGREYDKTNQIVLHLGNGASACAIEAGQSVDTSMGLTPLEGLVMGTRSGDIDPGVILHLQRAGKMSLDEVDRLLNRRSGMLGLAGANDLRVVDAAAAKGDKNAIIALDTYCYRLRKYVGAYLAVLGQVDVISFTGGVGENQASIRAGALVGLERFGIVLDSEANEVRASEPRIISAADSQVTVAVVPTDEELEIATQTLATIGS